MIFISIVDKKILLNQTDVDNSVINTIHIEINLTLALQTLINMMYDSERKGTEYSLFTDSLSISNSVLGTGLQDQQTYIP